jgi:2-polyprenyl-6-methoxyphenol hydroxylase-like FAD-dependent oxidoreductase
VIVGAGIGGLTLAYDLEQRGIDYVVLEKAKYVITSIDLLEPWGNEWRSNTIGLAWRRAWYSQSNGTPHSRGGITLYHTVTW